MSFQISTVVPQLVTLIQSYVACQFFKKGKEESSVKDQVGWVTCNTGENCNEVLHGPISKTAWDN